MLSPLLGLACLLLHASAAISAGADPQSTSAPERGHHTFWAGKLALLLSAIFTGAALYISAAEHPARMGLTTEAAHAQWKPAYVRGFAMQASLAVFAGCAGLYSYYIRGELLWVAGALTILANWPYTLLIMMATNKRLMAKHTDAHTRNLLAIVAGKEPKDLLKDIMAMLRNSASDPTMDNFARIMKKWAMDNGIAI